MAGMTDVRETLAREIAEIRTLLFMRSPFFAILIRRARIVLDAAVDTVCSSTAGELVINPFYWRGLSDMEMKMFVLMHEALHLGFRHPWAARGRDLELYNTAADMVVNEMLLKHGFKTEPAKIVTAARMHGLLEAMGASVNLEELKKASAEEIYRLLVNANAVQNINLHNNLPGADLESPQGMEGAAVQEGAMPPGREPELYWREVLGEALVAERQAGTLSGETLRVAEASLKPRLDWRRLLQAAFQEGSGRFVVSSWHRRSRRFAGLPGIKSLGVQTVRVLIDCSGSINRKTLEYFVSEILSLAKAHLCKVSVQPWDAKAYAPVDSFTPSQIRRIAARHLRGGGGTLLLPALKAVRRSMDPGDIVVILSDGCIADITAEATLGVYRLVAGRAGKMILVTTGNRPILPRTKIISMDCPVDTVH
jgi:predicted metal-dependent peptidase